MCDRAVLQDSDRRWTFVSDSTDLVEHGVKVFLLYSGSTRPAAVLLARSGYSGRRSWIAPPISTPGSESPAVVPLAMG